MAGLKEVPVIIKEFSDQETVEISLIENIQRGRPESGGRSSGL